MQIFLKILKETGIAILILALVALVVWLIFRNELPFLDQDIPDAIEYTEINKNDFDIRGDIEDETDPTVVYQASASQMTDYESGRYVSTGGPNPFVSNNADPDVPSEKVTISNSTLNNNFEPSTTTTSGDNTSNVKSLE